MSAEGSVTEGAEGATGCRACPKPARGREAAFLGTNNPLGAEVDPLAPSISTSFSTVPSRTIASERSSNFAAS